jgi:hypothetical protein
MRPDGNATSIDPPHLIGWRRTFLGHANRQVDQMPDAQGRGRPPHEPTDQRRGTNWVDAVVVGRDALRVMPWRS